jgi:hypothetical protein
LVIRQLGLAAQVAEPRESHLWRTIEEENAGVANAGPRQVRLDEGRPRLALQNRDLTPICVGR